MTEGADRMKEYFSSGTPGGKNVTDAGTPVALVSSPTPCAGVRVFARPGNGGVIVVGIGAGVSAAVASEAGWACLAARESAFIPCRDAADIYIDATVSGEGVGYNIVQL
jgi:hypothetical protein